ncbi:hypothetical protein [Glycomyces tarimensis]
MTAYLIGALTTIGLRPHLDDDDLEPLSLPETAHLVALLLLTVRRTTVFILSWSTWRRRRNKRARISHYRRREHPTP